MKGHTEGVIRSKAVPITKASGSNEIILDCLESELMISTYSVIAIVNIAWNQYEYKIISFDSLARQQER
jgi:hypothetical protein